MAEWASFAYSTGNLPIRVMTSHFVDFCRSKLTRPHFFCWAGKALALGHTTQVFQELFLRHLSLFTDRADTQQIFTRAFAGREGTALKRMLDTFMVSTVLYDLTFQWVLRDGPFHYDFQSLTGNVQNEAMETWAKNGFKAAFGHHPDDFELT